MNNFVARMIEGILNTLNSPKQKTDVEEIVEYTQQEDGFEECIMEPPIYIDDNNDSSDVVEHIIDNPIEDKQEVETTKVSKHWYNNGKEQVLAVECPDGWVSGKLKKKGN